MKSVKILCIEGKIVLCLLTAALLLGVITVTPCAMKEKGSLLGRKYHLDTCRIGELSGLAKQCLCKKSNG